MQRIPARQPGPRPSASPTSPRAAWEGIVEDEVLAGGDRVLVRRATGTH